MSNEQSIRDELADELADSHKVFSDDAIDLADEILACPVIRRIQAEAWDAGFDEASDDLGRAQMMRDLGESGNPYIERGEEL